MSTSARKWLSTLDPQALAWQASASKMQVVAEKLSSVLLELAVEVEAARVSTELERAYKQLGKTARIRGFRKGKAPRKVLSHLYGPRVAQDVAQKLVDETYAEALAQQNVQAVAQPAIESQPVQEKTSFSYKARVEIVPQIEKVAYEGFEVTKPSTKVSDEQIAEELEALRKANSTLEPPKEERAAQDGDVVTVDFDLVVDGEAVEGGGAKDFDAELGGGNLIAEIEKGLLGQKPGAELAVDVEMPEAHPNPLIKGKTATFKIVVKELKERVLPDLDDEFAKDLGDYETLVELKKELSEDIEKRLTEDAENAVAEALVAELVKANEIEVPAALVRQQTQATEQEAVAAARASGQQVGPIPPEARARIVADSEVKVRAGLLMAEIAKSEGLKIGDKELEEGMQELAEQTGKNVAKVRAEYRDPKRREMLIGMILENKVLDIIQSKSKLTETE